MRVGRRPHRRPLALCFPWTGLADSGNPRWCFPGNYLDLCGCEPTGFFSAGADRELRRQAFPKNLQYAPVSVRVRVLRDRGLGWKQRTNQ